MGQAAQSAGRSGCRRRKAAVSADIRIPLASKEPKGLAGLLVQFASQANWLQAIQHAS